MDEISKVKTAENKSKLTVHYREDICLQTLLLLFKCANHRNKRPLNVTVPWYQHSLLLTHNVRRNRTRQQTYWRFLRGTLPYDWLAYATSGLCDIEQPHLSPQHYKLIGKQHVLDRTRVLVSEQCTKANEPTSLGKSLRRLNRTSQE